jgi:hypothetical protein
VQKSELQAVKQALVAAGVEIYRTRPDELQIAERIRLHIMDSGVRVLFRTDTDDREGAAVAFTARAQRSDFPNESPEQLFAKVRGAIGAVAAARGYAEVGSGSTEVKDPIDANKVLDVWHEVTFTRAVDAIEVAVDEVRWALSQEKYINS